MKYQATRLLLACLLGLTGSSIAFGQDTVLPLPELPQNIRQAVHDAYPKASLLSATTRKKEGKLVYYDIEVRDGSTGFDLYLDTKGKVLSTGVDLPIKRLPPTVRAALTTMFANWKITGSQRETDAATQKISYFVELTSGKESIEVEFDAAGKEISRETL